MRLDVEQLGFSYDAQRTILEDVTFSLAGTGIYCILGKNGTGKSSLLKCIVGEHGGTGRVLLDGKERGAYGQRELARKIAYIPQNHTPTFPFRVLDVVMMGRTAHMRYFGSPGEREAELALHHLHFLGIAHLAEQPYTNISGGERQLVLLAAALTQQPELLILDEPTAHLDFGNAHRFLHLVQRLHAQGIGILMTTHFPDHALYLSAETLVLKDKTLWKHGTAAEVIDEAGMSALYGLPVHIAQIGTRTVCVGGDIA